MTVVLLIGCATFVYADFDRPGPEGKQKLILLYKELQLKSMIGQCAQFCQRIYLKNTKYFQRKI